MREFTLEELLELMVEAKREQRDPAIIYYDGADWTQVVYDLAKALICERADTADRGGQDTAQEGARGGEDEA